MCIFAAPPKIGGWDPKVVVTLGQDLSLRFSSTLFDPRNIDRMQQKYKTHIDDDSDKKCPGVRWQGVQRPLFDGLDLEEKTWFAPSASAA